MNSEYMLRAIELAKKASGFTSPNPLVGAVIVKDNRIIGEGYHHRYGDLHAERDALHNLTESAAGACVSNESMRRRKNYHHEAYQLLYHKEVEKVQEVE